ncbi:hypothetical protein SAMD00019534_001340 [Acytostelium subglobosum LB1]|uniref:hypothetical protein n=1 Tax=Acytostelium subglobosum LB1 TaxID=1410327 RepID=UPI000644A7F9|nr:hypothetical protein SAMD00019534_001340 [Acytostelium subglobosum LB1]GAM16959.1 hypothetical protein SAMD00019534_001340 [Acytostelium subglobosum LB1]|eukprot:XP_012759021.1 hypothetical protein SAMD00019534_001340 [Acytostelium subglobosum LB1]
MDTKLPLLCFHAGTFGLVSYGILWIYQHFLDIGHNPFALVTFLTVWGQLIHFVFFFMATIVDLMDITSIGQSEPGLYYAFLKCRDLVYRSIAFPIGMFITLMFWILYNIDPALLMVDAPTSYPPVLNHIQHTMPAVVMVIEMLFVNHQYHRQLKPVVAGLPTTANVYQDVGQVVSFNLTYLSILVVSRYVQGHWVYPFFEMIPLHSKIIFIFSSSCLSVSLYIITRQLNRWRWGGETEFLAPIFGRKKRPLSQQPKPEKKDK